MAKLFKSDKEKIKQDKLKKINLSQLIENNFESLTNKDKDILNMRDELLGNINQTLYLFTFK
jgi:DNA-directed RNA polymerase sigma subunit (sigma70/sigma32)